MPSGPFGVHKRSRSGRKKKKSKNAHELKNIVEEICHQAEFVPPTPTMNVIKNSDGNIG